MNEVSAKPEIKQLAPWEWRQGRTRKRYRENDTERGLHWHAVDATQSCALGLLGAPRRCSRLVVGL